MANRPDVMIHVLYSWFRFPGYRGKCLRLRSIVLFPEEKRYTRTNIAAFTRNYPLLESGPLGPVEIRLELAVKLRPQTHSGVR